jgi:nucleotide-binding universal stress UspA family protein
MREIRTILYPTDFSPCAEKAFGHAILLAKAFGSRLILFHAVVLYQEGVHFPGASERLGELYASLEARARANLPDAGDVEVDKVVARGVSAAEEILGFAKQTPVDLIVMGTHGRGELAQLFLGSVTERVIRGACCSVLTVRSEAKPLQPDMGYRRIVLSVDFSEDCRGAASWVRALSRRFGSEVHFVHVVEDSIHPAYFATGRTSIRELIPDVVEKSEQAMGRLAEEAGFSRSEIAKVVLEGKPSSEIARYCGEIGADLLCVGARGMSGLDSGLLGSTAERLVRKAPCAVLVAR